MRAGDNDGDAVTAWWGSQAPAGASVGAAVGVGAGVRLAIGVAEGGIEEVAAGSTATVTVRAGAAARPSDQR